MHGTRDLVWVEHIAIIPACRRQGLASGLLGFIAQTWPNGTLHAAIHPGNQASLALFRAAGAALTERTLAYVTPSSPDSHRC